MDESFFFQSLRKKANLAKIGTNRLRTLRRSQIQFDVVAFREALNLLTESSVFEAISKRLELIAWTSSSILFGAKATFPQLQGSFWVF